MTSAIEYAALWTAAGGKLKHNGIPSEAQTMEQIVVTAHAARSAMIADAFAHLAGKLAQGARRVVAAQKRRSAAAQLLAMDDRMLRDIGLTRAEVPMVVSGMTSNLATGETPNLFAGSQAFERANQANENRSNRAA
ncbi:MAG: DUF1127 domain-containing protein [Rhodospirillales bacterium]